MVSLMVFQLLDRDTHPDHPRSLVLSQPLLQSKSVELLEQSEEFEPTFRPFRSALNAQPSIFVPDHRRIRPIALENKHLTIR
jgi:hypothetical protein